MILKQRSQKALSSRWKNDGFSKGWSQLYIDNFKMLIINKQKEREKEQ